MQFIEKNLKIIGIAVVALIVVGLASTLFTTLSERKEKSAQESFSILQAKLSKLNEKNLAATDSKEPTIDVVALKNELQDFITKNLGTVAAQIAGLSLADILSAEKNNIEALTVLKKGGKMIIAVPNNNPYLFEWDDYHTLNLPPHHAGLWNKTVFKNIENTFSIKNIHSFTYYMAVEPIIGNGILSLVSKNMPMPMGLLLFVLMV